MKNLYISIFFLFVLSQNSDAQILGTGSKGSIDILESLSPPERESISEVPAGAVKKKSYRYPLVALALSAGTYGASFTLGTFGLRNISTIQFRMGLIGIVASPFVGHAYAGELGKGAGLSALSALGWVVMAAGGVSKVGDGQTSISQDKLTIIGVGLGLHLAATLYAIVDAPFAARRTNRKHQKWMVVPAPVGNSLGLGVAGSF